MKGKGCKLNIKEIDIYSPIGKGIVENFSAISRYTLMYEDTKVLDYDKNTDKVTIYTKKYLPFALKNLNPLFGGHIVEWLSDRISNISRTYMNMVYIARKVGRDKDKVLIDSSAISITDNYWVKTKDVDVSWEHLKKLRDQNYALTEVALTGKLIEGAKNGITSLFTLKGHFAKGIIGGFMFKLKTDAVLEYPAYLIGRQLNIVIAECAIVNDTVKIKLFTDYTISLVHASELKKYYNEDLVYNAFRNTKRYDILKEMQRMYIFNYIIGNPDLHEDNYGFLYNAKTFEIISLAPCFDHNIAFKEGFDRLTRETVDNSEIVELDDLTKKFICNNLDIVDKLKNIDLKEVQKYLNKVQLKELKERIQKVISWSL